MNSLRHIDERAARPYRTVESREFVIMRSHELHEVFVYHVGILALERAFHVGVDNALGSYFFAYIVVNQLGVILRTDARE